MKIYNNINYNYPFDKRNDKITLLPTTTHLNSEWSSIAMVLFPFIHKKLHWEIK